VVRNVGVDRELTMMRWGMPPPPRGRLPSHQHQEHVVTALADLAQASEPLIGPSKQLRRIRTIDGHAVEVWSYGTERETLPSSRLADERLNLWWFLRDIRSLSHSEIDIANET
jgi:hypothetical protein